MLNGTCVGEVDGLTEGALDTQSLLISAQSTTNESKVVKQSTIEEGKVALLDCTCVGEVDGLTVSSIRRTRI